jgi:hypothetical protein
MTTMDEIQQRWGEGYRDGWRNQSTLQNPPEPTIPPFPGGIPPGTIDPGQYAHDKGREAGALARMRVQAGI